MAEICRPPRARAGYGTKTRPLGSTPTMATLLTAPVFIFSAPRSGSTLLRAVLGSHTDLYAPPELPLKHLGVRADTKWIEASLDGLELTIEDLEHMLWDRVLADALQRSGKPRIVVKTPSNVLVWERIAACWPDARHVFLLRHPAAAVASTRLACCDAGRTRAKDSGGPIGPFRGAACSWLPAGLASSDLIL